jgi:hypothetical protein
MTILCMILLPCRGFGVRSLPGNSKIRQHDCEKAGRNEAIGQYTRLWVSGEAIQI